jgi:tetratricopeptide (TPR) repeat protein
MFLYQARQYPEALTHLDRVVNSLDPTLWTAQLFRAEALFFLGRPEDSLKAIPDPAKFPNHPHPLGLKGFVLARMNRVAEADAALAALPASGIYQRAVIQHALGREDQAIADLREAITQKAVHVTFLGVDPRWDTLRRSRGFREQLDRVRLVEVSDRIAQRYVK